MYHLERENKEIFTLSHAILWGVEEGRWTAKHPYLRPPLKAREQVSKQSAEENNWT
jgi:hypothetical protein